MDWRWRGLLLSGDQRILVPKRDGWNAAGEGLDTGLRSRDCRGQTLKLPAIAFGGLKPIDAQQMDGMLPEWRTHKLASLPQTVISIQLIAYRGAPAGRLPSWPLAGGECSGPKSRRGGGEAILFPRSNRMDAQAVLRVC